MSPSRVGQRNEQLTRMRQAKELLMRDGGTCEVFEADGVEEEAIEGLAWLFIVMYRMKCSVNTHLNSRCHITCQVGLATGAER